MQLDSTGELSISFSDEIDVPESWTEKMENDAALESTNETVRMRALQKASSFNFLSMKVGSPANDEAQDEGLDQSNMIITGITKKGLQVKIKF